MIATNVHFAQVPVSRETVHVGTSTQVTANPVNRALAVEIACGIPLWSCSAPNAEPNTGRDLPAALTVT